MHTQHSKATAAAAEAAMALKRKCAFIMDRVERATGPPDSLPLLIGWMKRMLPRDSEGEFRRQGDSPCCLCVSCLSSRHPPRFINLCRAGPLWQVGTSTRRAEGLWQRLRFFGTDGGSLYGWKQRTTPSGWENPVADVNTAPVPIRTSLN